MKQISIIGAGMGNPNLLTLEAKSALGQARLVVGSGRLMEDFASFTKGERAAAVKAEDIAALVRESTHESICILMSGDIGFYSGARKLYSLLDKFDLRTIPGITSVQYFAARLRRSWQDMHLVSAHGLSCDAVAEVLAHRETFFLTGGEITPAAVCAQLADAGMHHVAITVGERLSFPDEAIVTGTPEALRSRSFHSLSVLLADNPAPRSGPAVHGLPDAAFLRGQAPMTKREIRSVALSMLAVRFDDVLWDVGAGTGSVSVEMALQADHGHVYAVEKKEEAVALLCQNRHKHGAWNLTCVQGEAPQALEPLPAPDAVFIGGSGGELDEIMGLALRKNPSARIVVTAVTLETLTLAREAFKRHSLANQEVVQVAVSRAETVSSYHMMKAQNPVFILSGGPDHE